MRLHGYVQAILSLATADLDGFQYAIGIGVVSGDAFAVGITAVPKPFDDINWSGWLFHKMGAISVPVGGQEGTPGDVQLIEIDAKSMRKLSLNDVLFGIVQVGEVGTSSVQFRMGTRILLKVTETG